jgi:hypothetical protein
MNKEEGKMKFRRIIAFALLVSLNVYSGSRIVSIRNASTELMPSEIKMIPSNLTLPMLDANRYWQIHFSNDGHNINLVPVKYFSQTKKFYDASSKVVDVQQVIDIQGHHRTKNTDLDRGDRLKNGWVYLGKNQNDLSLAYRINGNNLQFFAIDYKQLESFSNQSVKNEKLQVPFKIGEEVFVQIAQNIFTPNAIISRSGVILEIDPTGTLFLVRHRDPFLVADEFYYVPIENVFRPVASYNAKVKIIAYNPLTKMFLMANHLLLNGDKAALYDEEICAIGINQFI